MRIIHTIPGLAVRGGGGNRACAELCQSLAALGHDVSLYYVDDGESECFAPQGVDVRRFPARLLRRYAYSPALRRWLAREIPRADIVHIHALWQYPNLPAARIALKHAVPYVVQPHGSLHPWKLRHKGLRKRLYAAAFERRILRQASFIHVESEADQSDVLAFLPGAKTRISPCGAFAEAFATPGPQRYLADRWPPLADKTCILYLARIDVNKGVDLLLKAFARVAPARPDAALLIVGPDYAGVRQRMQQLCERLNIAHRVTWAGMVTEEERIWIFQQCDFYVLPSLSENFGISVLEAMFCAKPVITTTATPWAELEAAGAGLVVEPTADSLEGALRLLLAKSPRERAHMGENGRALALQKYEWNAIARQMVNYYEEAISKPCTKQLISTS